MNGMPIAQQYFPGQVGGYNTIIRRPLTDAEIQLGAGFYRKLQRAVRGLSVVCLIMFITYTYLLPTLSDPVTYDSVSIMLSVFMIVFGAMGIGMAVNTMVVRKKTVDAMRDGTGVEITGPAYRTRGMGKGQTWTVGPISFMPTRETEGILQEGAQACVLCVPRMKVALVINNFGLKSGLPVMAPPNLESMAVPSGQLSTPPQMQTSRSAYPEYDPSAFQGRTPGQTYAEEEPPPPPD